MKKEYIKPIIINIKICNDALLQTASNFDIGNDKPVDHIESFGMTNNFISRFSKK